MSLLLGIEAEMIKGSNQALFRSLADKIKNKILTGVLRPGTRLPASRQLAKDLGVSRNTVMQAYELLISDGFVSSRAGSGIYVEKQLTSELLHGYQVESVNDQTKPMISEAAKRWLDSHQRKEARRLTVPFSLSGPAVDAFPFDDWARLMSRRWRLHGEAVAQNSDPLGYRPLREEIVMYLHQSRGVICDPDQILIVSGAQQGIDLISRVLWSKGDQVVLEDPAFPGVHGVLVGSGVDILSQSIDEEGLMLDGLDVRDGIKTFFVTPSRNYPLGTTMSLTRRLKLLNLAREKNAWIVEDDFDSDFTYDEKPLTALQGMDRDGRVIYVGSFSRIIFPALRLGYVVLPHGLVEPFMAAKSFTDGHTSIVHQAALADFFKEGYFNSHLRRMTRLYKMRRDVMSEKLGTLMDEHWTLLPHTSGLHMCVKLKGPESDVALAERAWQEGGIKLLPLSGFFAGDPPFQGFVLPFANFDTQEIEKSLDKLALLFKV